MKSTESKVVRKKGKVITSSRTWTKEQYKAFKAYQQEYYKDHYRSFNVRFSREKDGDIIEKFESQDNLIAYLRELVRKDIKENK